MTAAAPNPALKTASWACVLARCSGEVRLLSAALDEFEASIIEIHRLPQLSPEARSAVQNLDLIIQSSNALADFMAHLCEDAPDSQVSNLEVGLSSVPLEKMRERLGGV